MNRTADPLAQGECDVCGMPGIVGMSCSDPDCRGMVKDLQAGSKPSKRRDGDDEGDRYDKDLLEDDHDVMSLDDLEEEEEQEEDDGDGFDDI